MKKSLWILLAAAFAVSGCGSDSDDNDCGNGVIDAGEECDDGNQYSGDGCSSICRIEKVAAVCGNGKVEPGEGCDDGNKIAGDGCSPTCTIEVTQPVCGNKIIENDETCDDGNTVDGDGCSSTCQTEVVKPVCGNKVVEAGETCDDGNTVDGDGCSSTCQIETSSDPVCGNTIVEAGETCDDGNTVDGDGCSSTCQVETSSDPVCGNTVVEAGETCDDGNTVDGDGCSSTCQIETSSDPVCGNGIVEVGEACDPAAAAISCASYDSSLYVSGNVTCSSTCEVDVSSCVKASEPACGNGLQEGDEECDWTDGNGNVETERACSEVVPGSKSGKATCKACKVDTSSCQGSGQTGFYWCQLMAPVELSFDDVKKSALVEAHYGVGDDITESAMSAELVFGAELNTMSTLWKGVSATQNIAEHSFTATLTSDALMSLKDADGKTKFYYTFEIKTDGDADALYCRRNTTGNDPSVDNGKLSPVLFDADDNTTFPTAYDVGVATVSSTAADSVVAKFTFSRGKFDDGQTKFTSSTVSTYAADEGSGVLVPSGIMCNSNNCFAGGTDINLNVKNWKAAKADALKSGAYLQIKNLDTRNSNGSIKLEIDVWRNADNTNTTNNSATNIVVLYSTDEGSNYVEYGEIELQMGDNTLKKFFSYDMTLGNDAKNVNNLMIKLVPYGGNNLNRFDNIVISKNN